MQKNYPTSRPHALLINQKKVFFSTLPTPQRQPRDMSKICEHGMKWHAHNYFGDSVLNSAWFDLLPRWRKSFVHCSDYSRKEFSSRICSGRSKVKIKLPFWSYRERLISMCYRSFKWRSKSQRYGLHEQSDAWRIKRYLFEFSLLLI